METLELFFNNEEENAIYESLCFEPEPLQDRAELDKIIFDELGLTEEERKT